VRKLAWLLKHARVERLVVFKINRTQIAGLAEQLRASVPPKYRPPHQVQLITFAPDIIERTLDRRINDVPSDWYTTIHV
jgi:hypothetical protein